MNKNDKKDEIIAEIEALKLPIDTNNLFSEPEKAIIAMAEALAVCVDFIRIGWAVEEQNRHCDALKKAMINMLDYI